MTTHERRGRGLLTRRVGILAVFTVAALAACAFAQSATATLSGVVTDERGAVLPRARVIVSNAATGLQREVETDGEGFFTFPLLPPSTYTLRIERDGFAPLEIRGAALNVNDNIAYRVQMKVGGVGAYVLVEDVAYVDETAAVGAVVDRRFIENLPLNGRSFQTLFELAPGTTPTRASFNEQGQFSVNGQRANANYFTVDGVSANFGVSAGASPGQSAAGSLPALAAFGGTNNLVSVDALQEFRLQTSSYAPEFGRLPGAQVSIVTRSGTNELHGALFDYFRHDALDARDWFSNSRGLRKPALRQSDFGGVLGGPLVREKAFFFASYEGLRLRQPQVSITEVPSLSLRRAAPQTLRPFLDAFPLPNGPESASGLAEFAASYSDRSRLDAASLRVDALPSERLLLFARFAHAPSESLQRGRGFLLSVSGQSLNTLSLTSFVTDTLTAGATLVGSPRASNDLRVNWSRAAGATSVALDSFGGAAPFRAGLFAPGLPERDTQFLFLISGGLNTSLGAGTNADNRQRQFNVVEGLSLVAGRHQLKFGADYRRLSPVYAPARYTLAAFFGDQRPLNPAPGIGVAAVMSGAATQVKVVADAGPRFPRFQNFSAYAQDTWHVARRLTLNYGVRWELSPPPTERSGKHPLTVTSLHDPSPQGFAPAGTPLWRTTLGNFAPRLGAALRLSERRGTMLRGGVGLFYDAGNGQAAQVFGSVYPYTSVRLLHGVRFPLSETQSAPPAFSSGPPFDTVYGFDPRLKMPYSLQYNVSFEQGLGGGRLLSASYVAADGRRLLRLNLLPPTQEFREVRVVTNTARSDYDAFQLQFRQRLARGFGAQALYTLARSTDNASADSIISVSSRQGGRFDLPPDPSPSDFDVRHSASGAVTYDLPFRGARASGLLRGWSVDAIFRARTATPVNVYVGRELSGGDVVELLYPDLIPGHALYLSDPRAAGGRRINPAAFFSGSITGRNLGRNALRGFGMWQADAAVRRQFALSERVSLQLRAEAFNVFNHPNFGNPVGDLSSALFGQSVQMLGPSLGAGGVNGGLSPVYQVGGPRSIQLALRLQF